MADYINCYVFCAGMFVGGFIVYSICELLFPLNKKDE
jgi:hypothetical protein